MRASRLAPGGLLALLGLGLATLALADEPDCSGFATALPGGSPGEVAATPREDANLELLGLHMLRSAGTPRLTVPQDLYDRLSREVGTVRASHSSLTGVKFFPTMHGDGKRMMAATKTMQWETDSLQWSCANAYFGLDEGPETRPMMSFYLLEFKGTYDITLLSEEYTRLNSDTKYAMPDGMMGDGDTINVSVGDTDDIINSKWTYTFTLGSGDCPAGCINRDNTCFETSGLANAEPVEVECPAGGHHQHHGMGGFGMAGGGMGMAI